MTPPGRALRIALVSQEYPPETGHGGIGRQTHLKAHGLAARGHEVTVISAAPDGRRSAGRDGAVRVIRLGPGEARPIPRTEAARWLAYSAGVAAELAALDGITSFDIVDFPEWAAEGFVHLLDRPAGRRARCVIQVHGPLAMLAETIGWPEPGSEFHRSGMVLEGGALRLADAVYTSSAWSAGWVERAYGIPAAAMPVIHAGVDLERFRPRSIVRSPRTTVVFVGRIAASKGVGVLVEAGIRLASAIPALRLRLVGRDPDGLGQRLVARAVDAGQPDLVELVGPLHGDALAIELAEAEIFAAPSRSEGGPGFTFLEAMACGLPVVGPAGTGVAEAVVEGVTGFLVPSGEPEQVAAAIGRLLMDEPGRRAMGARARAHVEQVADTRRCIERLEGFYRAVIADRAGADPGSDPSGQAGVGSAPEAAAAVGTP